jgi:hypothetical protein
MGGFDWFVRSPLQEDIEDSRHFFSGRRLLANFTCENLEGIGEKV